LDKHLHIISLDVPFPANYGGVYDLFFKLPALQAQGVKIHLHCFDNGRGEQTELNTYCEEVHYYHRNTGHKGFSSALPYIVSSRKNEDLLQNLLKDDYPIFMEGVHCTYPVLDNRFNNRRKFVRIHNVEHQYYKELYNCAQAGFKKMYYGWESNMLKKYEAGLVNKATAFWAVTQKDTDYYRQDLHCNTMDYLPLFIPPWQVKSKAGMGSFCLYHGNLEVAENEYAATWLLKNIFNTLEIPLVIAGKNPSAALEKLAHQKMHTCLVANPGEKELQDLIAKAQVHILPSFNNTGIKIKLLNALFNGRHCLVNSQMIDGTGLDDLCVIADDKASFRTRVEQLYSQPFSTGEINSRRNALSQRYSNEAGARQMVDWIWNQYA
jgi:Glycosyl transferases group 1